MGGAPSEGAAEGSTGALSRTCRRTLWAFASSRWNISKHCVPLGSRRFSMSMDWAGITPSNTCEQLPCTQTQTSRSRFLQMQPFIVGVNVFLGSCSCNKLDSSSLLLHLLSHLPCWRPKALLWLLSSCKMCQRSSPLLTAIQSYVLIDRLKSIIVLGKSSLFCDTS